MIPELNMAYTGDSIADSDEEHERRGTIDFTDDFSSQLKRIHTSTNAGTLKEDRPYSCVTMVNLKGPIKPTKKRSKRKKSWKVSARRAMKNFLSGSGSKRG